MDFFLTWTGCAAAALALLVLLYSRLARSGPRVDFDAEWWESFSADRYTPLGRLLEESDFAFLRESAGYTRTLERRLRRQRGVLFAAFLFEMRSDFDRLQAVGRAMVMAGQADSRLLEALLDHKLRFTRHFWLVRLELALWHLGLGRVNASVLVESLRAASLNFQPALNPVA